MLEGLICPICENTIDEIDLKESLKCTNCAIDLKNRKFHVFRQSAQLIIYNTNFVQRDVLFKKN